MSEPYKPPYSLSDHAINRVSQISELIGSLLVTNVMKSNPKLRRNNRVRTIHASLAIENNSLTLDQVTAIINGKRVLGPPSEILEVQNAYQAYERLMELNPYMVEDLLLAHSMLMRDLVKEAGKFRSGGVGIFAGNHLIHMAPPADFVPQQIYELIQWTKNSEVHPLVKSCVFHYEFEFIHPFSDGNGRMGRMWQTLLLSQWKPFLAWLPVESIIRDNQEQYYQVLAQCDKSADSGAFISFMLDAIYKALLEIGDVDTNIERILNAIGNDTLPAREIMQRMGLSNRASFRRLYLLPAVDKDLIEMTVPDKPNSSQQKYRRK